MRGEADRERELAFMEAEHAREMKRREAALERQIDRQIVPVVMHVGHKHFAMAMGLGIDKQDRVYHWIERRNGQRPPAELLAHVHEAPGAEGEKAIGDWCEARGYERPRRKVPSDESKYAHTLEDKLRSFGELGEQAIQKAREESGRRTPEEWELTPVPPRLVKP